MTVVSEVSEVFRAHRAGHITFPCLGSLNVPEHHIHNGTQCNDVHTLMSTAGWLLHVNVLYCSVNHSPDSSAIGV